MFLDDEYGTGRQRAHDLLSSLWIALTALTALAVMTLSLVTAARAETADQSGVANGPLAGLVRPCPRTVMADTKALSAP